MLLGLLEFVISSFIIVFMATQVVVPLWNGTILFSAFRKKARALEKERIAAEEELAAVKTEIQIDEILDAARAKRKSRKKSDIVE